MEEGFAEIRKLFLGKNVLGTWLSQSMTCAMLNIKVRQLQSIRIHIDNKSGKQVGCIRWRKGKGKSVQYHKADIEAYLNQITVG